MFSKAREDDMPLLSESSPIDSNMDEMTFGLETVAEINPSIITTTPPISISYAEEESSIPATQTIGYVSTTDITQASTTISISKTILYQFESRSFTSSIRRRPSTTASSTSYIVPDTHLLTDTSALIPSITAFESIYATSPPINTASAESSLSALMQPGSIAALVMGGILLLMLLFGGLWCICMKRKKRSRWSEHYNLEKADNGKWIAQRTRKGFFRTNLRRSYHQKHAGLTVNHIGSPKPYEGYFPMGENTFPVKDMVDGKLVQMPMMMKSSSKASIFKPYRPTLPKQAYAKVVDEDLEETNSQKFEYPRIPQLAQGKEMHIPQDTSKALRPTITEIHLPERSHIRSSSDPGTTTSMSKTKDHRRSSYTGKSIYDFYSADEVQPLPTPPPKDSIWLNYINKIAPWNQPVDDEEAAVIEETSNAKQVTLQRLDTTNLGLRPNDRTSIFIVTSPNGTDSVHTPFQSTSTSDDICKESLTYQTLSVATPPESPLYDEYQAHSSNTTPKQIPVELVDPQHVSPKMPRKPPPHRISTTLHEIVVPPGESPPLSPVIFTFDTNPQNTNSDNEGISTEWRTREATDEPNQTTRTPPPPPALQAEIKHGESPSSPESSFSMHTHPRFSFEDSMTNFEMERQKARGMTAEILESPVLTGSSITSFESDAIWASPQFPVYV